MDYRIDSINGWRKLSGKTAIRSSLKVHSLEMNCLLWLRLKSQLYSVIMFAHRATTQRVTASMTVELLSLILNGMY